MDYDDYEIRAVALECAVSANGQGTSAEKIIEYAEKFYGFMVPENGVVAALVQERACEEESPFPETCQKIHEDFTGQARSVKGTVESFTLEKPFVVSSQPDTKPVVSQIGAIVAINPGTVKDRVYNAILGLWQSGQTVRPFDLVSALNISKEAVKHAVDSLERAELIKRFKHHARNVELLLPHEPDPEKLAPLHQKLVPGIKPISAKAQALLDLMIDLTEKNVEGISGNLSFSAIQRAFGSRSFARSLTALVRNGYVRQTNDYGAQTYRVAKQTDGKPYLGAGVYVREDGVTVCPPRYSPGYGIQPSTLFGGA